MNQLQHDEPEEQQPPPAAHPAMSTGLKNACYHGDVGEIRSLLDDGESVNCVTTVGNTPIVLAMRFTHLHVVQMLADKGADLTMVDNEGLNLLHNAADVGNVDCLKWVLANTTIDVNSTINDGETSIAISLFYQKLDAAKYLIENGANLFMKTNNGKRAIDVHVYGNSNESLLGPQVLQHALDLRWVSVRHLLLISNFHETSDITLSAVVPQRRSSRISARSNSAHLAASVFTISGLVRHIAEYLIRTELIVRDPLLKKKEKEPDDVKRRVEATLAANEKRNKKKALDGK
jgi:hypothetical protein